MAVSFSGKEVSNVGPIFRARLVEVRHMVISPRDINEAKLASAPRG